MTFSDLLAAAYEECNCASSPASAVVTRLKRYVNEGVRAILIEPGLERLADSDNPLTFASVASQARYVLPESVARIHAVTERTNDQSLRAMDKHTYRHVEPDPSSNSGNASHYVPFGRVAVAVQPADASEIFVKSTAAGDTTQTAYIEGIITGGYMRTASVVLTGATAVTLSAAITSFIEITDFYISAAAVGTVTLHEDSGLGTELARITIGQKRPRYYGLALWPTPSAVVTYYVDYRREVTDLVNDADEPPLATDAHSMLVAYAVKREAEKTGNVDLLTIADARYQKFLSRLKYQTQSGSDELPVMGRGALVGRSRLGGMYPADLWSR
jgi:hypothetical protein